SFYGCLQRPRHLQPKLRRATGEPVWDCSQPDILGTPGTVCARSDTGRRATRVPVHSAAGWVLGAASAAKDDVVYVDRSASRRAGLVEPVAERVELCGVRRVLSDRHVVAKARCADAAVGRLVHHVVSPEAGDVVLVVAAPAPLQRHANRVLRIYRERRIGIGIARVPNLLLRNQREVVIAVDSDPLHLWLLESVADGSRPRKVQQVGAFVVSHGGGTG